jgi:hypothetical protein
MRCTSANRQRLESKDKGGAEQFQALIVAPLSGSLRELDETTATAALTGPVSTLSENTCRWPP